MKKFFDTRAAARTFAKDNNLSVKDSGCHASVRWYVEVPASPVKIVGLLDVAREAKKIFTAKLAERHAEKRGTNSLFVCQLFYPEVSGDWERVVEPHMNALMNSTHSNNVFSHIGFLMDRHVSLGTQMRVAEIVRLHWLDALIAAAEKHGDYTELPPLMEDAEIIKLVKSM